MEKYLNIRKSIGKIIYWSIGDILPIQNLPRLFFIIDFETRSTFILYQ